MTLHQLHELPPYSAQEAVSAFYANLRGHASQHFSAISSSTAWRALPLHQQQALMADLRVGAPSASVPTCAGSVSAQAAAAAPAADLLGRPVGWGAACVVLL